MAHAAASFYKTLLGEGTSASFRERMYDFTALNHLLGTPAMLELGKRYESEGE